MGESFLKTLPSASGGRTPYEYSVSGLPARGLSFNSSTRRISGTPTSEGTLSLTYRVTDDLNRTKSRSFTIRIDRDLVLPSVPDYDATVGQSFVRSLPPASGGRTPYDYTLSGLPARGLFLDSKLWGIAGRPTSAGTLSLTYSVTDAANQSKSRSFTIRIDRDLVLPSVSDSDAMVRESFSKTLPSASGGRTPYSYSVSGLPARGLSFNSSTRRISGTPSSAGTLSLTSG